jgi:hypothetical protein
MKFGSRFKQHVLGIAYEIWISPQTTCLSGGIWNFYGRIRACMLRDREGCAVSTKGTASLSRLESNENLQYSCSNN